MDINDITNDLFKYNKKSLYKIARTVGEVRLNTPFDYTKEGEIIKRTISPHIIRNNVMFTFLKFINDHIVLMIKSINYIKLKRVYTVDKEYEYIK